MQYKFPYIHGRPMILAKLRRPEEGKARYFEFLIDTGADYTLISQHDAQLLGIQYNQLDQEEIKVEVANLAFIHTKKALLILTIQDQDFLIPVLISKEEVESLLGRKGIFDHFDILFQESKEQVIFIKKGKH